MKRQGAARFWYWLVVLMALVAFVYLLFEFTRGPTPAVMIDFAVVLIALGFLARAHPKVVHEACPQCGAAQDPVRATDGRRLWACRACGWERVRLRSRRELEQAPPPTHAAPYENAPPPGSRLIP